MCIYITKICTHLGQGGKGEVVGQLSGIYETITTKTFTNFSNFLSNLISRDWVQIW